MRISRNPTRALFPRLWHGYRLVRSFLFQSTYYHEWAHRREFMRRAFHALKFNGITGDYAEFGCGRGLTFRLAYRASRRAGLDCRLWAFDSFHGLPPTSVPEDRHPAWIDSTMRTSMAQFTRMCAGIPPSDYSLVPGFYEDTIGRAGAADPALPADIALAYIDCDLFSSTKTVLDFLSPRLKHGMIVAFDDYYCYSATDLSGERRAALDFLSRDHRYNFAPYVQYGWHGMSFVVEERALLKAVGVEELGAGLR